MNISACLWRKNSWGCHSCGLENSRATAKLKSCGNVGPLLMQFTPWFPDLLRSDHKQILSVYGWNAHLCIPPLWFLNWDEPQFMLGSSASILSWAPCGQALHFHQRPQELILKGRQLSVQWNSFYSRNDRRLGCDDYLRRTRGALHGASICDKPFKITMEAPGSWAHDVRAETSNRACITAL